MHLTLYLTIMFLATVSSWLINVFFVQTELSFLILTLYGLLNPVFLFGLDAVVATIIHKINPKHFDPYIPFYRERKGELKIYRKMNIVAWKDFVPDTGILTTGLSKSHIEGTKTDYLHFFLVETCYAEIVHYGMCLCGFVVLFFCPKSILLTLILPQVLVNFFLNIPPILIQRNNRPKLLHMYEHQLKKTQEAKVKE